MKRIPLQVLKEAAKGRPEGYLEDVLSHGTVKDNFLHILPKDYGHLLRKYRKANEPINPAAGGCCNKPRKAQTQFPPVTEQLRNVASAAGRVIGAWMVGKPVLATEEEVERRKAICGACPELIDNKCRRCGCPYQRKIKLATEACPLGKWAIQDGVLTA